MRLKDISKLSSVFVVLYALVFGSIYILLNPEGASSLVSFFTSFTAIFTPFLTAVVAGTSIKRSQESRRGTNE